MVRAVDHFQALTVEWRLIQVTHDIIVMNHGGKITSPLCDKITSASNVNILFTDCCTLLLKFVLRIWWLIRTSSFA